MLPSSLCSTQIVRTIFIIFLCSNIVIAFGFGECPKYFSFPNFNINKFAGQWFEVERSFYAMETASSCTSLNFTVNARGNLNVVASTISRWIDTPIVQHGVAIQLIDQSAILRFKFKTQMPFMLARLLPGAGIYRILYTDYDNVAVVWSCTDFTVMYTDKIWVLGRSREISETLRIEVYSKIRTYNLDPERLIISKNKNCSYA